MAIIKGFNSIDLVVKNLKRNNQKKIKPRNINLSAEYKKLNSLGFHNGKILNCLEYKVKNKVLSLRCEPINFFDFYLKSFPKNYPISVLNVNAIINIKGSILLIKRNDATYCFQGFLDFPAGLAVRGTSLTDRLIERIEKETGLNKRDLSFRLHPDFVEKKSDFFSLYYIINCSLEKSDARKIISNNPEGNNFILANEKLIKKLLPKERIYPLLPIKEYFDCI